MSNLATIAQFSRTSPQLPLSWYFDPKLHELEQQHLFANGPKYVGHELMVPNQGDYYVLPLTNNAKTLVRNAGGVEMIGNVCRHRQAILLQGKGNARNIVCPLHRWTYDTSGTLLGAPHFPGNPCLNLPKTQLQNWNGLLFAGKRDIAAEFAKLSGMKEFDFSGYVFDRTETTEYHFNWKTFIEVYQELYHVVPFHPGLGHFVDCDNVRFVYGDSYSVQIVGVNQGLEKPGTAAYEKWHKVVRNLYRGEQPPHGALWMTLYPNIMVEWYPHVLVVSTVAPKGPEKCVNVVEFYYPEEIALFEREFVEAEQKAYAETAIEDQEICERMTAGRRALYEQGIDEPGPYQSPMEDALQHFHEWMWKELGPRL
jgi:choline monooxygenase